MSRWGSTDPFFRALDDEVRAKQFERLTGRIRPCTDGGDHRWEPATPLNPTYTKPYHRCAVCGRDWGGELPQVEVTA